MESSDRELLQQALDVIHALCHHRASFLDTTVKNVRAAIRARLAEPEAADESERLRLLAVRAAAQDLIDYEDAGPDDGRHGWLYWEEKFDALRSALNCEGCADTYARLHREIERLREEVSDLKIRLALLPFDEEPEK